MATTEYNNTFKWTISKQTLQHILSSTQREQFVSSKFVIGKITWQLIGYPMYDTGTFHLYLRPFGIPPGWNRIIVAATLYCLDTTCGDASIFTYNKVQLFRAQHWSPGCLSLNEIRTRNLSQLTLSVNVQILRILSTQSFNGLTASHIIYQYTAHKAHAGTGAGAAGALRKQTLQWAINDTLLEEMKQSLYGKCFISFVNDLFCLKIFPNGYQQQGQVHIELQWFGIPIEANNTLLAWKLMIPEANIKCDGIHRFSYDTSSAHWGSKILSTQQLKQYNSLSIYCEIQPSVSPKTQQTDTAMNGRCHITKLYDEIHTLQETMHRNYEYNQHCISHLTKELISLKQQQQETMKHCLKQTNMSMVHEWLTETVQLPQYFEIFLQNGYDDINVLCDLNEEDLGIIGIDKCGHRKKIIQCIAALNVDRVSKNTNSSKSEMDSKSPVSHKSEMDSKYTLRKRQKINKILKLKRSKSQDDADDADDWSQMTEVERVKHWLRYTVKLPQYFEALMTNGYDDFESIVDVTMDELEQTGVNKMGHRKKIVKYALRLSRSNDLRLFDCDQSIVDQDSNSDQYINDETHEFVFPPSYSHNIWSDHT